MMQLDHAGPLRYRIEHLRDRLAREEISELGVRIEMRGSGILLWGTVTTPACRDAILRIAAQELAGLPWRQDLQVGGVQPPHHRPEELS
ncbi:BON domain-containing protein [Streptomyces sp. NPDC060028]|uniref:BON domain-containing protein n=1 Tax=Streptomyces sp. NPDC060028 TaxID=3347041 RepID=UPI00367F171C